MKLLFSLLVSLVTLCTFSSIAYAQDIPNENGEEIIISIDESTLENGIGRSLPNVPLRVTLFRPPSLIAVEFPNAIGLVTITLTNITYNTHSVIVVDSIEGNAVIPITQGVGYYKIEFVTTCGIYIGFLVI